MSATRHGRALAAVGLGLALCACQGSPVSAPRTEAADPTEAALRVLELARLADPPAADVEALFGTQTDTLGAALLDALAALEPGPGPRVLDQAAQADGSPVVLDLAAELPGGGEALYSVVASRTDDGTWRVVWFLGPGVEWPPAAGGRGEGLSLRPGSDPG